MNTRRNIIIIFGILSLAITYGLINYYSNISKVEQTKAQQVLKEDSFIVSVWNYFTGKPVEVQQCVSDTQDACGNGVKDPPEECDDGNTVSGDGCSSKCIIERTLTDALVTKGNKCELPKKIDANVAVGCQSTTQVLTNLGASIPQWDSFQRYCKPSSMGAEFTQPRCSVDLCSYELEIYPKVSERDSKKQWWLKQVQCGSAINEQQSCSSELAVAIKRHGQFAPIPSRVAWHSEGSSSTLNSDWATLPEKVFLNNEFVAQGGSIQCVSDVDLAEAFNTTDALECAPSMYCERNKSEVGISMQVNDVGVDPNISVSELYLSDLLRRRVQVQVLTHKKYIDFDRETAAVGNGASETFPRFYIKVRAGVNVDVAGLNLGAGKDIGTLYAYDDGGAHCLLTKDTVAGDGIFSTPLLPDLSKVSSEKTCAGDVEAGISAYNLYTDQKQTYNEIMKEFISTSQQYKSRLTINIYRTQGDDALKVATISVPINQQQLYRPGTPQLTEADFTDYIRSMLATALWGPEATNKDALLEIVRTMWPNFSTAQRSSINSFFKEHYNIDNVEAGADVGVYQLPEEYFIERPNCSINDDTESCTAAMNELEGIARDAYSSPPKALVGVTSNNMSGYMVRKNNQGTIIVLVGDALTDLSPVLREIEVLVGK